MLFRSMPFTKRLRSLLANPGQYSDCLVWDQEGKSFIGECNSADCKSLRRAVVLTFYINSLHHQPPSLARRPAQGVWYVSAFASSSPFGFD